MIEPWDQYTPHNQQLVQNLELKVCLQIRLFEVDVKVLYRYLSAAYWSRLGLGMMIQVLPVPAGGMNVSLEPFF